MRDKRSADNRQCSGCTLPLPATNRNRDPTAIYGWGSTTNDWSSLTRILGEPAPHTHREMLPMHDFQLQTTAPAMPQPGCQRAAGIIIAKNQPLK